MSNPIMKFFEYAHLPEKLQAVSRPVGDLAKQMDETVPDSAEKSAGLRKLLEAKDCLVRAVLVLAIIFAIAPQIVPAEEVPWHLQPMDTWHAGECYRSPNVSNVTDDGTAPAKFKIGDVVTVSDVPAETFTIVGEREWYQFKGGRYDWAYPAKNHRTYVVWKLPEFMATLKKELAAVQRYKAEIQRIDAKYAPGVPLDPPGNREGTDEPLVRAMRHTGELQDAYDDYLKKLTPEQRADNAACEEYGTMLRKWKAAYEREQARKNRKTKSKEN